MIILAIETSCDETAICLLKTEGKFPKARYEILANFLHSQVDIHKVYGGVFPSLAKREHAKTLVPLTKSALTEVKKSGIKMHKPEKPNQEVINKVSEILKREEGLSTAFIDLLSDNEWPEIDLIAVTKGPGLEPALWVGVSYAKALAYTLDCPVVPVNHMEGHILSAIYDMIETESLFDIKFPALSLLISGGHTEFILMSDWYKYKKIGSTKDDAVGEAFDKVARLLELPYPGGPEISREAERARRNNLPKWNPPLPRPMLNSPDLNLSFSGLKTAVRYAITNRQLERDEKATLCREFEDSVSEVILKKTRRALTETKANTLIVGGGVSANQHIRRCLETELLESHKHVSVYFPEPEVATDNAIMIALCGHAHSEVAHTPRSAQNIQANGNLSFPD